VLLIACANVANLLLARAVKREREFAIRAALGAGRARVLRQLAVESLLLGLLGGVGGVLLAYWGVNGIKALAPSNLPRVDDIAVDGRLLGFALIVSLGTALLYGLVPALRATTPDLHETLKAAGRSAAGRARNTLRSVLVVAQIAVAIVLIVGAGLLVRSFVSLLQVDRGFRTDNVLAVSVQAWGHYTTPAARANFVEQTVERIAALRDVRGAGVTSSLPLHETIGGEAARFARDDRPPPGAGEAPTVHAAVVSPGYFGTLGIPLRRGRLFASGDRGDAPPVAIVSEALAERYFTGEDPVGKRITVGAEGRRASVEIVGVVGNVRQTGLDQEASPTLYFPFAQSPTGAIIFTVRTAGDPTRSLRAVKEEIWALNESLPIAATTTVEGLLDDSLRERRFHLTLLAAFAATALLLAAVGIYGVMSHATSERTREIGVRMALGARASDVLAMIMRQGGSLAAVGLAAGLLGAAFLTRLLRGMLFGVGPIDPLTFVGGSLLVLLLAAAATYVPAQRAMRIEPTEALRGDG
jgi:predicted permease